MLHNESTRESNAQRAAMKTSSIARLSLLAALALSSVLVGCGATDEDLEAQYPNQAGIVGTSDESLRGLPPGASVNSAADVAAADDAYARGYAAGQAQSVNGSVSDGQTVVINGDDGSDYADTDPSALTDFRSTLDPYGSWVDDETYGTVWYPSSTVVGTDFQPYVSAGHWVYDNDYVWVSDYEWGWAPFHYGRWITTTRGWAWIPGRAYSGAWVSWRMGYDGYGYLGWAPLAPTWYWRGGYAYGLYSSPYAPYSYCSYGHVFDPRGPRGHVVTGPQAGQVAAHTRPYQPATPSVDPHSGANPRVNGAVASVSPRGPAPISLGLSPATIPRSSGSNAGLARARSFASPQAAQTFGGHAPIGARTTEASRNSIPPRSSLAPIATGPRYIGGPTAGPTRVPYASPRSPQAFTRPSPQPYQGGGAFNGSQSFARPSPSQPSTFQQRSFDNRTFSRPAPFQSSAPHTSSSPGFAPHQSFSSPSFRSAPSSAPSFHSAPSFRSAPSSPSFHSAPSGGGGSFHAPSAPRPSSHPSVGGGGGRGRR